MYSRIEVNIIFGARAALGFMTLREDRNTERSSATETGRADQTSVSGERTLSGNVLQRLIRLGIEPGCPLETFVMSSEFFTWYDRRHSFVTKTEFPASSNHGAQRRAFHRAENPWGIQRPAGDGLVYGQCVG